MRDPGRELRLVVGKVALLLAFVYFLVLVAALIGIARGDGIRIISYVLLLVPAAAFAVSSRDAVTLHRTSDTDQATAVLKRCTLYAGVGLALLIIVGVTVDRMNN